MTSAERREARYQRRVIARQARKDANRIKYDNYDELFTYRRLYSSYRCCRHGVSWKASVQKYITNAPLNIYQTYRRLKAGTYRSPGFFEFDLFERGKKRHIRSTVIGERIVQRTLCDHALIPALQRTFIYDNGATMKHKGYDFAIRRITEHLRQHYREHGNEGYILLFDFSKFFDNVSHELVKKDIRKNITDERIIAITEHLIDMFGEKGMGLGSQISQVLALASGNKLDHYVKEVLRIKRYGRYMDDGYLIHHDKKYLQTCLVQIKRICDELGIVLNIKKTHIFKLSRGFSWLKARIYLTKSGKIVKKIYKRSITRQRRKMKKLKKKWKSGKVRLRWIFDSFRSWKGYALKFSAWHTVQNMLKLYNILYLNTEEESYHDLC